MRRLVPIFSIIALLAVTGTIRSQVLLRTIPAPSTSCGALTWDGEAFWVGDNSSTIYRVNPENGAVLKTISSPENISSGLAWDGTNLWVAHGATGSQLIHKIDTTSGAVISSIPDPADGRLGGLSWRNGHLWATQRAPQEQVLEIDPSDGAVLSSFSTPTGVPYGLAFDDTDLWLASEAATGDFIRHLEVPGGSMRWSFAIPEHTTFDERRLRGVAWNGTTLWFVAFIYDSFELALHEYDVANAHASDINVSETYYNFGDLFVGEETTWTTSITNLGAETLTITGAEFGGPAFSVSSPESFPVNIEFGNSIDLTISFAPPAAQLFVDSLLIVSNDPDENPVRLNIYGNGLSNTGDISTEPSVSFGSIWLPNPGLSTSRTLEINNVGDGTLTVTDIEITLGDYFRLEPVALPAEIDSHDVLFARIWFEPVLAGTWDGILTISSDDFDQPVLDVSLTGSANTIAFEAGDIIWQYWAANDQFDNSIDALHWINDVNGDDAPDVISACANGLTFCLNGTSSAVGDTFWTYNSRLDPNHSGAVSSGRSLKPIEDITGDGIDDVLLGTGGGSRSLYALSGETGEEIWMFDTHIWDVGGWVYAVESMGDVNGDFVADVAAVVGATANGPKRVFAVNGINGSLLWQGQSHPNSFYSLAVLNDVTGDGNADVVGGSSGEIAGYNGATGSEMWVRGINGASGIDSPAFELVNMGNANPSVNTSEDVAVASAYDGIYSIDGQTGVVIWRFAIQNSNVYQVCAGSDITGDDVREVYAGTVAGHVICIDGALGTSIWNETADPVSPENVLSMTNLPDVTGDAIDDILCGTLGDFIVVLDGWSGEEYFATTGAGPTSAIDAVGVLPDIDNNESWEVLAGNRAGMIQLLAGGSGIPGPEGWIVGSVRSFGPNLPLRNVEVSAEGTGVSTLTNANGNYSLSLPPGTYTVNFHLAGYCDTSFDGITVEENVSTTQNANLMAINGTFSVSSLNVLIQQPQSTTEEFEITNPTGGCALVYSITDTSDWLSVEPTDGEVQPNESQTVVVTFTSDALVSGSYQSALMIEHNDEDSPYQITVFMDVISPVSGEESTLPTEFMLYNAYPNPFNSAATLNYDVANRAAVRIVIYNALGQRIRTLLDETVNRGRHSIVWDGTGDAGGVAATGIYFIRMDTPDYSAIRKIVMLK